MLKIIFPPLPDECIDGYAARICRTNGSWNFSSESLLQELVISTGLQATILIQHHTHLSYRRFICQLHYGTKFALHDDIFTNSSLNRGLPISSPRLCSECVKEDLEFHGISYWRRSHQLPGVCHCTKHMMSLFNCHKSDLQHRQPSAATQVSKVIEDRFLHDYLSSNSIHKFVLLSEYALHATEPLKPSYVLQAIRTKIIKDHAGSQRAVHLLICRNFPDFWLGENFPKFLENAGSETWLANNGLLKSKNNTYATKFYLLLMAVLWNSPEEAIRDCLPGGMRSRQETNLVMSEMALLDFISGNRIKDTCRKHQIPVEDFEVYLRKFISDLQPISLIRSEKPNSGQTDGTSSQSVV